MFLTSSFVTPIEAKPTALIPETPYEQTIFNTLARTLLNYIGIGESNSYHRGR
jgi:hypothetical protein